MATAGGVVALMTRLVMGSPARGVDAVVSAGFSGAFSAGFGSMRNSVALGSSGDVSAPTGRGRGIDRGELPSSVSITLLLDTLVGGAMMHALTTPPERRAALAEDTAAHARRLVDFLLHDVTAPAA